MSAVMNSNFATSIKVIIVQDRKWRGRRAKQITWWRNNTTWICLLSVSLLTKCC